MELTEVDVDRLTGKALDWATGGAAGKKMVVRRPTGQPNGDLMVWEEVGDIGGLSWFAPSTNWMHGGPLIEQFIGAISGPNEVRPYAIACQKGDHLRSHGDTMLMAACRSIVWAKYGVTVLVPTILLEDAA